MQLSETYTHRVAKVAEDILSEMLELLKDRAHGTTGVMFQIFAAVRPTGGPGRWAQAFGAPIGVMDPEFAEQCRMMSHHAATNLMASNSLDSRMISSWQIRIQDSWTGGGSFILIANVKELGGETEVLFSTSGFPSEDANELFGLLVAKELMWSDDGQYGTIIKHSGNMLAKEMASAIDLE